MAKKKTLDDMRDEAYRREDNLASDIDELLDRVNPKNAISRWKNEVVGSVKSFTDAGDGKTSATLPIVAGGVIGVIVLGAGITAAIVLSGDDDKVEGKQAQKAKQAGQTKKAEKAKQADQAKKAKQAGKNDHEAAKRKPAAATQKAPQKAAK